MRSSNKPLKSEIDGKLIVIQAENDSAYGVRRIPSPHGRLVSFAANELHFEAAIKANYNLSRWISDKTVISRVAPLAVTKFNIILYHLLTILQELSIASAYGFGQLAACFK